MKTLNPLVGLLATGLLLAPGAAAADGEASTVEGSVTIGGHVSDIDGTRLRVREYFLDREQVDQDLWLDLFGYGAGNRFDLKGARENDHTLDLEASVDAGSLIDFRMDHTTFNRWLDHDRLTNLQWREAAGYDSTGAALPGGKMLTFEDTDPGGVYSLRYTDTEEKLNVHVPLLDGAGVSVGYREQHRTGMKQVTGVDHCANCHVRAKPGYVNEQTRDLTLAAQGLVSDVKLGYEFAARDFDNRAAAPTNRYMEARHPTLNNAQAEFGSRLIYDNETLEFSKRSDTEKRQHTVRAAVDLPNRQSARGSLQLAKSTNTVTGLELKSSAASVGWYAPLTRKMRATAGLVRRSLENDPYRVDLPPWRDGMTGGGQDFDYTRLSAYDREEYVGTARLNWALKKGHSLRLDYRLKSTDRDHVELDPDDPSETRTLQNRVQATWNGRLSGKARSRVSVEYEKTSFPFVSVDGICEEAQGEELMPLGGSQPKDFVYYFQRERFGTGGNLPTGAVRANANVSFGLGPKVTTTAYANVAFEKNDDLNLYDFEREAAGGGVTLLLVPDDSFVFTGGASHSRMKSNAKLCATVMDG